jgi:hypothetical protein
MQAPSLTRRTPRVRSCPSKAIHTLNWGRQAGVRGSLLVTTRSVIATGRSCHLHTSGEQRVPRLRRVRGYKHLPALRRALRAHKQQMEAERAGKSKRKKAA